MGPPSNRGCGNTHKDWKFDGCGNILQLAMPSAGQHGHRWGRIAAPPE
jgi:hypothetical protein